MQLQAVPRRSSRRITATLEVFWIWISSAFQRPPGMPLPSAPMRAPCVLPVAPYAAPPPCSRGDGNFDEKAAKILRPGGFPWRRHFEIGRFRDRTCHRPAPVGTLVGQPTQNPHYFILHDCCLPFGRFRAEVSSFRLHENETRTERSFLLFIVRAQISDKSTSSHRQV